MSFIHYLLCMLNKKTLLSSRLCFVLPLIFLTRSMVFFPPSPVPPDQPIQIPFSRPPLSFPMIVTLFVFFVACRRIFKSLFSSYIILVLNWYWMTELNLKKMMKEEKLDGHSLSPLRSLKTEMCSFCCYGYG